MLVINTSTFPNCNRVYILSQCLMLYSLKVFRHDIWSNFFFYYVVFKLLCVMTCFCSRYAYYMWCPYCNTDQRSMCYICILLMFYWPAICVLHIKPVFYQSTICVFNIWCLSFAKQQYLCHMWCLCFANPQYVCDKC